MFTRKFTAAKNDVRCKADIRLRDGSGAQCMRAAKIDGYCKQHARLRRTKAEKGLRSNEHRTPNLLLCKP